jgi:hypothetical protein
LVLIFRRHPPKFVGDVFARCDARTMGMYPQ